MLNAHASHGFYLSGRLRRHQITRKNKDRLHSALADGWQHNRRRWDDHTTMRKTQV